MSQTKETAHHDTAFWGTVDWLLRRVRNNTFLADPLNGQAGRRRFVESLFKSIPFQGVVETGTFRGSSTLYFSELTKSTIYSCELSPRHHTYAKFRCQGRDNIKLTRQESREFLRELARDTEVPRENIFFYLDAHWHADLPLKEEMKIVSENWRNWLVLVDDFQVPGDSGYGFDDYGDSKKITCQYLLPSSPTASLFFPAIPSQEETGLKRGCALLTDSPQIYKILKSLPDLREHLEDKAKAG